ncbi:MAG: APC family permease, partial [Bacteroidetes bacterium]|nr:APC family permease [Bacteroidota bacterium]
NNIVHLPPVFSSMENFNIAGIFYPFEGFNIKLTAIVVILVFTWINTKGVKTGAGVSTFILALVFIGIFMIIIFGLSSTHANVGHVFEMKTTDSKPVTLSAIFASMLAAFWAYQGWAAVGYIGGEVKNAKRNMPLGIIIGVFIIITIYLLINTAYLSLLSVPQLEAIYKSQNSIAAVEAVKQFWGSSGVVFISVMICITTLSATHATIFSACRMYYAMAKEKLFFAPVSKLNKENVPAVSMWYQGIWACVLVLSGTFDQLTDMIIFAVFIYYGATALGVFVLRKKMPDAPRPYKVWGYPIIPGIVVLFSAVLFINTIIARPREAAIGMALMLTGVPLYFWFREKQENIVENLSA